MSSYVAGSYCVKPEMSKPCFAATASRSAFAPTTIGSTIPSAFNRTAAPRTRSSIPSGKTMVGRTWLTFCFNVSNNFITNEPLFSIYSMIATDFAIDLCLYAISIIHSTLFKINYSAHFAINRLESIIIRIEQF